MGRLASLQPTIWPCVPPSQPLGDGNFDRAPVHDLSSPPRASFPYQAGGEYPSTRATWERVVSIRSFSKGAYSALS